MDAARVADRVARAGGDRDRVGSRGRPTSPSTSASIGLSAVLATAGAHGWSGVDDGPRAAAGAGALLRRAVGGRPRSWRSPWATWERLALDLLEERRGGLGFAVVYAAAAVAGVLAWLAMRVQHHPTPRRRAENGPAARAVARGVGETASTGGSSRSSSRGTSSLGVSVPFWANYMEVDLGMSTAAHRRPRERSGRSWAWSLAARVGARSIDRVGTRPVLLANAMCIAGIPFLWLLRAGRISSFPCGSTAFAVGVFWTGFNLTALNVPLAAAPKRGGVGVPRRLHRPERSRDGDRVHRGGVRRPTRWVRGRTGCSGSTLAIHQVMFLASGILRVARPARSRCGTPRPQGEVPRLPRVQVMGTAVRQRFNLGLADARRRPGGARGR